MQWELWDGSFPLLIEMEPVESEKRGSRRYHPIQFLKILLRSMQIIVSPLY
jgi:hypothetical protein